MNNVQIFELLALATLVGLAVVAILLIRRISGSVANAPDLNPVVSSIEALRHSQSQVDSSVREELSRNRQEAAGQSQSLRSEVLTSSSRSEIR